MAYVLKSVLKPLTAGFVATAPLIALELVNQRGSGGAFPLAVFGSLWAFATIFLATAGAVVRRIRQPGKTLTVWLWLAAGIAFALAVGMVWTGFVADQMPCFLGVPNCD